MYNIFAHARARVCVCVWYVLVFCYEVYVFVSTQSLWLLSYRLDDPAFESRKGQGIFSLIQKRPYRLCGPSSLLFDGYQGFFPGGKGAGEWSWPLTLHSADVTNEWMYASVPFTRLHDMHWHNFTSYVWCQRLLLRPSSMKITWVDF